MQARLQVDRCVAVIGRRLRYVWNVLSKDSITLEMTCPALTGGAFSVCQRSSRYIPNVCCWSRIRASLIGPSR